VFARPIGGEREIGAGTGVRSRIGRIRFVAFREIDPRDGGPWVPEDLPPLPGAGPQHPEVGPLTDAPRSTMRWPPPLPGRAGWSWLLGLRLRAWRLRDLLRFLRGRVPARAVVVDVGSGPGFALGDLARAIGPRDRSWVMLDPQRAMLRSARGERSLVRRGVRADRILGDAIDLPFRNGSADLVLSLGVLCCVADAAVPATVAETVRVLKPGGLLLFAVPRRRGEADDARWQRAGLVRVRSTRPGRGVFQKTL